MTFIDDLAKRGAVLEHARVQSFGDSAGEFAAFADTCAVVPLLATRVLKATGADRLDFVHGQVSNEVKRLEDGAFSDALVLNHKGHALAQLRIFRLSDALLLSVEGGASAFVQKQLEAHIIFDQVRLEPLDDLTLTLQGKAAPELVKQVFDKDVAEGHVSELSFEGERVLLSPSGRSLQGGYDFTVPAPIATPLFERLLTAGALAAGEVALNLARVSAGIPHAEFEGGEGVLPQEAGLEPLVSYTKGCYLGQEIMARIEARGKLRRSLQRLGLERLPGPEDREIKADGKTVGRLGTVTEHPEDGVLALAVLRTDLAPDADLGIGNVKAQIVAG